MTAKESKILANEVALRVVELLNARTPVAPMPPPCCARRLTVKQFAFVIERSEEYVRRRIRGRVIPRGFLDGPPYLIDTRALTQFGVGVDLARLRLLRMPDSDTNHA